MTIFQRIKGLFVTTSTITYRERVAGGFKDRHFKTVEEAKSHAFRRKMNNGGDYVIMKSIRDPDYLRVIRFQIVWPGFLHKRSFFRNNPIPAGLILIAIASGYLGRIVYLAAF